MQICICELFLLPLHQILRKVMKKLVLMLLFLAFMVLLGVTGCNVTRAVTTRAECIQSGDSSVVIQIKTTEAYDATGKDK